MAWFNARPSTTDRHAAPLVVALRRLHPVLLQILAFLSVATSSTVLRAPTLQGAHGILTRTCASPPRCSAQVSGKLLLAAALPDARGWLTRKLAPLEALLLLLLSSAKTSTTTQARALRRTATTTVTQEYARLVSEAQLAAPTTTTLALAFSLSAATAVPRGFAPRQRSALPTTTPPTGALPHNAATTRTLEFALMLWARDFEVLGSLLLGIRPRIE